MTSSLVVVAATANEHKLNEMRAVFGHEVELLARPDDLDEVVEDASTFVGNARLKAVAVAKHTGHLALADDSGLEVDALDGDPGVESAYYGGGDHDDGANRRRLLAELAATGSEDRRARFRTVFVLAAPDGTELVVQGTCEGRIGDNELGSNGFGYDPLFHPDDGDGRTFGQMTDAEKNEMSHRSKACGALIAAVREYGAPGGT